MALPIPKDVVPGIISIINLPDETINELAQTLAASSVSSVALGSDELAEYVASQLPSMPFDQLTNILEALYSLYYIREFSGVRSPRFLDDLVDSSLEIPDIDALRDANFIPILEPGDVWSHPNFLGLDGFLNHIRFAIDAQENAFYFGQP